MGGLSTEPLESRVETASFPRRVGARGELTKRVGRHRSRGPDGTAESLSRGTGAGRGRPRAAERWDRPRQSQSLGQGQSLRREGPLAEARGAGARGGQNVTLGRGGEGSHWLCECGLGVSLTLSGLACIYRREGLLWTLQNSQGFEKAQVSGG